MTRDYYIFSNGRLKRKDNTIFFVDEEDNKKAIPVETIRNLYVFGELDFNTKFFNYLGKFGIAVHIFNYYGFYGGSFMPRKTLLSGDLIVKQAKYFTSPVKQLPLAKETITAAMTNMKKNLLYYTNRGRELKSIVSEIEKGMTALSSCCSIEELMGLEGMTRKHYFEAFPMIISNPEMAFTQRVKQPPDNAINALISFGNMLLYTTVLSEIFKTQLDPTISFLHKPGYRRYSLSLDIAEIFKPILVDRIIFKVLNKNMITEKDFDSDLNYCYMNENARKVFVKEYDQQLQTTIKHRTLDRHISYRHLIRLECYKLIKCVLENAAYNAFKIWW
jgi:CRISPR-associated protein Cas1